MKDNYGTNHVRVKGNLKVLCHLMFDVLVLTEKKMFNYLAWLLTTAVLKTMPIVIGKEVYAPKHGLRDFFKTKLQVMRKNGLTLKINFLTR